MPLEQPKRPAGGAFGIFFSNHRAEFAAATKGQRASAAAKMAGEKWKLLSERNKAPYQKEFALANARYESDMKAFLKSGGVKKRGPRAERAQRRKIRESGGKVKRDPNRPKRPAGGAFGVFQNKHRKEFQKQCPGHIMGVAKVASAKWKALSDAAKKPYEKEAARLTAVYKEAMKTYKSRASAAGDSAGGEEREGDDDAEKEKEEEQEEEEEEEEQEQEQEQEMDEEEEEETCQMISRILPPLQEAANLDLLRPRIKKERLT